MTVLADIRGNTFAAMRGPNFRRYITGQAISLVGTWMQTVAQSWLVLQLTGSATAIGIVLALQTVPMLLLGPYGGVVADRSDKRKLMIGLQSMMGLLALILGLLVITDASSCGTSTSLPSGSGSTNVSRIRRGSRSCSRWSDPRICATR